MNIAPYLNFDGTCAEAMAFYAQVFQGTIVHQSTFGEMPPDPNMPPLPESAMGRIMHAHLQFGHNNIMASDSFPSIPGMDEQACVGGYQKPQGLWVSIGVDSAAEGQRIFNALAEGGTVAMPYAATFWSEGFGMVTDRFATPWLVNVSDSTNTELS